MAAALADITQLLDNRLTYLGDIQRGNIFKAQPQHVHPQRKGIGARVAFEKAHILQRLHHAIGGRFRHIHQPVQLGEGQIAMLFAKSQQQLQAALKPRHQILHFLLVRHTASLIS